MPTLTRKDLHVFEEIRGAACATSAAQCLGFCLTLHELCTGGPPSNRRETAHRTQQGASQRWVSTNDPPTAVRELLCTRREEFIYRSKDKPKVAGLSRKGGSEVSKRRLAGL
jgi:hypothetical protein